MLRAKHIGAFSNGARSIFFNGPRCNTASDGSSCTCSEDESCVSRRQSLRAGLGPGSQPPRTTSSSTSRVQAFISGPARKETTAAQSKASIKQVVISSPVSYAATESNEGMVISDQFLRAGVAAVNFLSDVVNYKLPLKDGLGILHSTKNCMVDPSRVSSIRSSHVKRVNRESFSGPHEKSTRGGKTGPVTAKGSNNNNNNNNNNNAQRFQTVPEKKDATTAQRTHAYTTNVTNYPGIGGARVLVRPPRDMKFQPRQCGPNGGVVERASRVLTGLKWGRDAEQALESLDQPMDAYQANQVLKQLQDHNVAVGFFYWLKRRPGFKHDGHTYTTMVGILGRARQFGAINRLLQEMGLDNCRPNVVTYNRLIHSYGRANHLREAVQVFEEMQSAGCEPDRVTYCTLIDLHAKAGFLDSALGLYETMRRAGLSPDTFTYSVIINCLGKAGHLVAAHNLFREMVDDGCVPSIVTYNIMLALQAKARNYEAALGLYREMQRAGFRPDRVTYSIVMEVLGHCGFLDEAEAVFFEMRRENWVPDEPVYGLLVDLWGKSGNIEKAREWYETMLDAGLQPNVPTCNSLLSAFLRVHRLSDAHDLLRSMVGLGLNPSLQTYTLLLSCCTEASNPRDMGFCCELMSITNHPAHAFLVSMPPAGPDGQNVRDHATKFLDLMHGEDREGKRGLVDAVVDFLHKSGLKEEAGSVWEVAAGRNVYPDAVKERYGRQWLINLHVMSEGTAVTALARTLAGFRREMIVSGVWPERIDIVTGWGRRSRVTGTSLVRRAVQELLGMFGFPFFTENGNTGCFVGCGEPLGRWLLQPCVERMHLL